MKKLLLIFVVLLVFTGNAKAKNGFEMYGDIMQFLPLMAAIYTIGAKDYIGLKDLSITFASTMAITFATKYGFQALSQNYPNSFIADISLRPNGTNYQGFPSGHTASAFAGAGYLHFRYGYQIGFPALAAATLVGVSRIVADKHSMLQVVIGGALGYGMAYLFTNKLNENIEILPIVMSSAREDVYGIQLTYRW